MRIKISIKYLLLLCTMKEVEVGVCARGWNHFCIDVQLE